MKKIEFTLEHDSIKCIRQSLLDVMYHELQNEDSRDNENVELLMDTINQIDGMFKDIIGLNS